MNLPKEILHIRGIKPKKRLGQSFLIDVNMIKKIAANANISSSDIVLEIGAGLGVLTKDIAKNARRVFAVEIDPDLVDALNEQLIGSANVEVFQDDILKFNISSISETCNSKIKVIGNVPYNISSPVIFYLLSFRQFISEFTLMLQKEVVDRLISKPARKSYGVPSVLLQMFADVQKLFDVPASCFYPRPKVESAIIRGVFRRQPLVALDDELFFRSLVKVSFAKRRKMLLNNLKNTKILEELTDSDLKNALHKVGIDEKIRAENLSVEEFGHLSNILQTSRR